MTEYAFLVAGILILVLAMYDRLHGWVAGGLKGWLVSGLLGVLLWRIMPGGDPLSAAALALALHLWRDAPRNTLGSAIAPDNNRVPETLAFNLLGLLVVCLVVVWGYKVPLLEALQLWAGAAVAATAFAYLNHRLEPATARTGQDMNAWIEGGRGGWIGLTLAICAVLSPL